MEVGQGVITATTPALSVSYIQPLLVSSLAVVSWSSLRFCPSAGAGGLGAPWQILLWNKLLCWVWNIWLQSRKLSTRVICRAKWKRFFFCQDILLLASMADNNWFWWFLDYPLDLEQHGLSGNWIRFQLVAISAKTLSSVPWQHSQRNTGIFSLGLKR